MRATHIEERCAARFLLPAGLLAVAALASLAMFFPGTGAGRQRALGHRAGAADPQRARHDHGPAAR